MYTIRKTFHFSASHVLKHLPEEHPCSRLHGHNYEIIVEFQSKKLNKIGFIKDYKDMESVKHYLDDYLDHQHLNDILEYNPTAENMARHFFQLFSEIKGFEKLSAVIVKETPGTSAEYREDRNE